MPESHYLVPLQHSGTEKDLEYNVTAADVEDAEDWFVDAKERLWEVNKWEENSPGVHVNFGLTDGHGHDVRRRARQGDHIKIGIHQPGASPQSVHDWVIVEAIEYDDYPDENYETFAIHMRPVSDPGDITGKIPDVHLATSTLVVERRIKQLKATYHGRNEGSNAAEDTVDLLLPAFLGLQEEQWECLLKGLIGTL